MVIIVAASTSPARVRLGDTGLEVTTVGLGCWQFSGGRGMLARFWPALEQEQVNAIVSTVLSAGCDWFDTVEGCVPGHSERSLGQADQSGVVGEPPVS